MHPLVPDLSKLSDDELHKKYGELMKRYQQAYNFGPYQIIDQLQMLMGDYQAEIGRRNQKQLEELQKLAKKDGKDFKGIIDIQ